MRLPNLIGIAGLADSGKDTLAGFLSAKYGHVKYSLSSPIKALLNERFGWTDADWQHREWKETPALIERDRINGIHFGKDFSAKSYSPRQLAQWLGTEVGRNTFGENCWVDVMERRWRAACLGEAVGIVDHARMVVPDIRFDNEAERIRRLGGVVIRVIRPGVAPVNAHSSEAGVRADLVDVSVVNQSDITTLLRAAEALLAEAVV